MGHARISRAIATASVVAATAIGAAGMPLLTGATTAQAAADVPTAAAAATAGGRTGAPYVAPRSTKINVMGEWAHPDDDTSIIGPCGVWHQRYGTRCGIIQVTRGEGGGNATGPETGPALGLRRENEDRVAHYRSGTVDLFYLDRVDFFYNQSAPLTEKIWDQPETLRRVTRVIRTTQPDVFIGWTPSLAAGHGNHQEAGRLVWEGVRAAADPSMFPDQLRGPHALSTWQVKKVYSGGSTAGTGGTTVSPNCTTGFVPDSSNLDAVAGVWTGYDSPYDWPAGNVQGQPAGTPKIWQQVADEGRSAYPTQSRVMYQGVSKPGCSRFGLTESFVPFQPNLAADGAPNPLAGGDDAVLAGASRPDPGGLPLGTLEYLTFSQFSNAPGVPFQATLHLRSGHGTLPAGTVRLTVPDGWTVAGPDRIGPVGEADTTTVPFTVTPPADAAPGHDVRIAARVSTGGHTGYTDGVVRVVPRVEGRFHRWGKWAEYDRWLDQRAPQAKRLGSSDAVLSIGLGRTAAVPVDLQNRSDVPQSGTVGLELPAGLHADRTSLSYGPLSPGASTTVTFQVTSTDTTLPDDVALEVPITTTSSEPAASSQEVLHVSLVPTTQISQAPAAPSVDAQEGPGEYSGPRLDLGRIWQGAGGCTGSADCGTSSGGEGSWAKVAWHADALYFYVHVRDDYQSYAVTPRECIAHWLADSVEIMVDPRGNASQDAMDTASTFKLGVFPYTDDPAGSNGNGVNGPCWERDADNHQGYATGPLASTVVGAPNAPGVEVASSATWVGDNSTTTDHAYAGGGYALEVKIPMADLPAAVDPQRMAFDITPYDNDDTSAAGTTTLRHIDASTRLGWSAFNSVQSDPYRWGLATLPGYAPPAGRPATAAPPEVGHPNLDGTVSPQTIWQSARNGVPIAGRDPVAPDRRIAFVSRAKIGRTSVAVTLRSRGHGKARLFAWAGPIGYVPVWRTSCSPQADPPPDYGMTPCAVSDGGTPPWAPDMSGHRVGRSSLKVRPGVQHSVLRVTAAEAQRLRADGRVLISFVARSGGVQAIDVPAR